MLVMTVTDDTSQVEILLNAVASLNIPQAIFPASVFHADILLDTVASGNCAKVAPSRYPTTRCPIERVTSRRNMKHVRHLRRSSLRYLVEARPGHVCVAPARYSSADVLVERGGALEHVPHVRDLRGIPRADGLVERACVLNMCPMFVTCAVFHEPIGWLNAVAS